jgi:hypothetical protein
MYRLLRTRFTTVVSTCCFTGLVRVGVKIPQDGNRTNVYGHMATVRGHIVVKCTCMIFEQRFIRIRRYICMYV